MRILYQRCVVIFERLPQVLERVRGLDIQQQPPELLEHWLGTERRRECVRPERAPDIEENGREHAKIVPRGLPRQPSP